MKKRKLRGSSTGGRGYGKRARKAGNRGGRGRAGGGKRGQQKLMSFRANVSTPEKSHKKSVPLNLNRLGNLMQRWESSSSVKKDGDLIVLDLKDLGYEKVCGRFSGDKIKLAVYGKVSQRAKSEIEAAGGKVYE